MRGVWGGGGAGRRASGHPEAQTSSPSAPAAAGNRCAQHPPTGQESGLRVSTFCSLLPPDPAWSPDFLTCEVGPLPTAN